MSQDIPISIAFCWTISNRTSGSILMWVIHIAILICFRNGWWFRSNYPVLEPSTEVQWSQCSLLIPIQDYHYRRVSLRKKVISILVLVTCELTTPLLYWPIGGTSNCIFFLLSFIKPKYLPQNCCIWMSQKTFSPLNIPDHFLS